MRSRAPLWAALVTFAVVAVGVGGVLELRDGERRGTAAAASDPVSAQVVQLRRDYALGRVEVALTNQGGDPVTVERIRLRIGGFTGGGWVPKDSPVPSGQVVDLPTPYGAPRCPRQGAPAVGPIQVDVRLHTDSDPRSRTVTVPAVASRPLVTRILVELCTARRLAAEVDLRFGPTWRTEGSGDATRLHGTLVARLSPGTAPMDVTQFEGTVLYYFRADGGSPPYASLSAAHPTAAIPVVLSQARCTGHAKGEVKQPYRFLVWVGPPGTGGTAVEFPVTPAERARLRAVCAF